MESAKVDLAILYGLAVPEDEPENCQDVGYYELPARIEENWQAQLKRGNLLHTHAIKTQQRPR